MKASYKVNSKVVVELDFTNHTELFEQLASLGEVFGISKCEKCKKDNIKFVVRTDDEDHKYYSLDCQDCYARLSFGQYKKGGGLFIRRKDKEDNWIPDSGWQRWSKEKKCLE